MTQHDSREVRAAVLMLEDGTRFEGTAIGAVGTTTGEVAFNTGMYGYQEIFTDPSYKGQVLVMATAHIGNYGVHGEENESGQTQIAGLVVRNFSEVASRVGDIEPLADRLERDGIVGIAEVVREGYPDHTAFNPDAKYYDPKSDPDNPRWYMVDLKYVRHTKRTITLTELKEIAANDPDGPLADFPLVRRGNRLSIMPVTDAQWALILGLE